MLSKADIAKINAYCYKKQRDIDFSRRSGTSCVLSQNPYNSEQINQYENKLNVPPYIDSSVNQQDQPQKKLSVFNLWGLLK